MSGLALSICEFTNLFYQSAGVNESTGHPGRAPGGPPGWNGQKRPISNISETGGLRAQGWGRFSIEIASLDC